LVVASFLSRHFLNTGAIFNKLGRFRQDRDVDGPLYEEDTAGALAGFTNVLRFGFEQP